MRVLFLDQFSDWGGAQMCLKDVLLEVQRLGWEAEVMAPGDGPLLTFARECGFDTSELPITNYKHGQKSAADMARFSFDVARSARLIRCTIRRRPANLIYVNGPRILASIVCVSAPVLFHSHSVLHWQYERRIATLALKSVQARIIACSEFAAQPWRSEFRKESVRVIHNGVADHGFRPLPKRAGPLQVGILGRIAPEKGHLDFCRAAAAIPDRQHIRFSAIGAPLFSDSKFEGSVRAAGKAANVSFHGWVDDVSRVLHDLDILVAPSAAHDASPRVILEAFSAGVCVLAYPSGGIPELIRDGHNGLLASRPSHEALAVLIRLLCGNDELRNRLAANGRHEWEMRFRLERFRQDVCSEMASLHQTCVSARASSSKPAVEVAIEKDC